jgi:hypothetical protein
MAKFQGADLKRSHLKGANFEHANLQGANLKGAHHLTIAQLSKLKTLYDTKLDEEFLIPLKEKYPALFNPPDSDNQRESNVLSIKVDITKNIEGILYFT